MAPLVSIFLCVKNGMPFLPEALRSVAAQTYRDFEFVVQDGGSTDGTLDIVGSTHDIPNISIVSGPDSGVGDARDRALRRCRGEIIGSIDADNLLTPDALRCAVETFQQHPECAAIYGSSNMVDHEGKFLHCFQPSDFDPFRLMQCELVPPFAASFFQKKICGVELRFERSLGNCEDFELWLRLSHLPILRSDIVFNSTRLSLKSMTRNADTYESFCRNKAAALETYLRRYYQDSLIRSIYRFSVAGIYLWAAESIYGIEGESARYKDFCQRAADLDPTSKRLENLKRKVADEQVHAECERIQANLQRAEEKFQVAERESERLRSLLHVMENSRGWRMLQKYRALRDRLKKMV